MSGLYTESSVLRKTTVRDIIAKGFGVFACVILCLMALTIGGSFRLLFLILATASVVGLIMFWPRFNVEWEYVYCDGQLDFDMIMGGQKRKHVLRVEIAEAAAIAPMDSVKMDGYRHLSVLDYTSLDNSARVYGIVTTVKNQKCVVYFEPTDKMLDLMKIKCPNIVEYQRTGISES